ncbi:ATP-grasp domain-containing protein [Chloroflexota bacterium]
MSKVKGKMLLFIGGGAEQVGTIKWAADQGIRPVVVDIAENALGFQYAEATLTCDIRDIERILAFAREQRVDGVTTVCLESGMSTVAYVVEQLGLPGLSPEATLNVTNKYHMRRCWEKAGLPVPKYQLLTPDSLEDSDSLSFDNPWVVKPADNAGSRGVQWVENHKDLAKAYHNALAFTRSGEVLVEEFIPGTEISVEGFVLRGELYVETLSDKNRSPFPYLFDLDIVYPSRYPEQIQREAVEQTRVAVKALGIEWAPVHEELMVTPDGQVYVMEIAGRGPGSKIYTSIIPHVSGVHPARVQVICALGDVPEKLDTIDPLRGATIMWFQSWRRARIKMFHGLEEGNNLPGVFECRMYKSEGEIAELCTSGDQRLGQLITMADTWEEAVAVQRKALEKFSIEYEDIKVERGV